MQPVDQRNVSPRYDGTQENIGIAVSYFYIDNHRKIWVRSPLKEDFIIEDPYTGDDRFSVHQERLFKIPYLHVMQKHQVLIAVLWLEDHKLYSDHLVKSGNEFYRCLTGNEDTNWILIPLYSKRNHKPTRNPVLMYHAEKFKRTLIIKDENIYNQLVTMFDVQVNAFKAVINDKMKWMIQFPDGPANFL